MYKNLVDCWFNLGDPNEFLQLLEIEVAHTYALRKASSLDLLHLRPGRRNVRLRKARVMDQVEVDVLHAEL